MTFRSLGYVFPANNLSVDPHDGKIHRHHIDDTAIQAMISLPDKNEQHQ